MFLKPCLVGSGTAGCRCRHEDGCLGGTTRTPGAGKRSHRVTAFDYGAGTLSLRARVTPQRSSTEGSVPQLGNGAGFKGGPGCGRRIAEQEPK
jgi:hypothetical protein